jgi:hypothetical protein
VTKSSNHTLCLHRLTSTRNSSSVTNFPWLSPTDNGHNCHSRVSVVFRCTPYSHSLGSVYPSNCSPYIVAARTTQHRKHVTCQNPFLLTLCSALGMTRTTRKHLLSPTTTCYGPQQKTQPVCCVTSPRTREMCLA